MKRIEMDADTGGLPMSPVLRPPMLASKQTPVSAETGVRTEMVAGPAARPFTT